jgi:hypothetical protein
MHTKPGRREFLLTSTSLMVAGSTLASADARAADSAALAPPLEFVMMVTADIADPIALGASPAGERRIIPITGGRFEGPKLKGIILPGGEDAQFDRADGVTVFEARYWLKAEDGAVIKVLNRALRSLPPEEEQKAKRGQPYDRSKAYLRTQPEFEAPIGPHEWLNRAIFVGTLSPGGPKQVVLRYFKVA